VLLPQTFKTSNYVKVCKYSINESVKGKYFSVISEWIIPEKIHTPPTEEISAVRRGRGEKIVCDNSKCIRTSEGGREVNFQFPP
jgi:hypothetical protein